MKTVLVVQARMQSTRLPGKVLLPLRGTTVLGQMLARCREVRGVDAVCCAVAQGTGSEAIAAEAHRAGVEVVLGSEQDVLGRYLEAARALDADVVMRATSDCPLLDPRVCEQVLELRSRRAADYACNNQPPSWPHGLDCEAFTRELLERAHATAQGAEDREHVTEWMRSAEGIVRANLPAPRPGLARHRWTLDRPEDYDFLVALLALVPAGRPIPGTFDLLALLDAHPEIVALNALHAT